MNKTEFISAIAEKAELSKEKMQKKALKSFHRRSGRRTEER